MASKSDLGNSEEHETPPKKSSGVILDQQIEEATSLMNRPNGRLFVSGLSAGLDLGFSVFLIAIVHTLSGGVLAPPAFELIMASMYAFGFILVILGRSELFTEQTTLAVLPVLNGTATVRSLLRLWAVVFLANMLGATAFAALIAWIGPAMGVIEPEAFGTIAHNLTDHTWTVMLVSAVLAGWLMGLLSWLVAAGRDTISQILIVWIIATAIGLGHLHHSILGSIEVLAGLFAGQNVTAADFAKFLFWSTLGNAIGGSCFVALIKYSQVES